MTKETLIDFPCQFTLKIIGEKHDKFKETVLAIVQEHAPETADCHIKEKDSSQGQYTSLTVEIQAQNQDQLDDLYRQLTAHKQIKFVL